MTNDLAVRVFQHKIGRFDGFTKQYRIERLVYFESFQYVRTAIAQEKEIKHWVRQRRVQLIESINPAWEDLASSWFDEELLTDPNAPAVIKYDPTKLHGAGGESPYRFKNPMPEQAVRIKFRPSRVRTFGGGKDNRQR